MGTINGTSFQLPLTFNGKDYLTWAFKFEQWRCLWRVFVEDLPTKYDGEVKEFKWRTENAQGYSALTMVLGKDEFVAVIKYKDRPNSAKLAWEKLRDRWTQKSHMHRLEVRNRLVPPPDELSTPLSLVSTLPVPSPLSLAVLWGDVTGCACNISKTCFTALPPPNR